MKPYTQKGVDDEQREYNCLHSRTREVVENLFGIVANRWHVFRGVIQLAPSSIESLVMVALISSYTISRGKAHPGITVAPQGYWSLN